MNIGIDIRSLLEKKYSGVSVYTLEILKSLFLIDKKNNYFLFYNCFSAREIFLFESFSPRVKLIKTRVPNKIFNLLIFLFSLPKLDRWLLSHLPLGEEKIKLDLFFLPNWNFFSFSNGVKKVFVVYDLSYINSPKMFSWWGRFWHRLIKIKKHLYSADKIIAISNSTKEDLLAIYKLDANKIGVIYGGVGENFCQREKSNEFVLSVKKKYSLPDDFILYLGNIDPRKNVLSVIRSFNYLKQNFSSANNVSLVIVGSGWNKKYLKMVATEISKSEFVDQIKYLGYLEEIDKPALYNLASVFLFPSWAEGFGLPVVEAMASGVPVVASFNSSFPEVVGEAGLLIDPNNISEQAWAIDRILTDNELKNKLIENGLIQSKKFTWENSAKKLLLILENFKS